jgi:hypothetical protein
MPQSIRLFSFLALNFKTNNYVTSRSADNHNQFGLGSV